MKEIGTFRRVDELGRIVIPKSIRIKNKIRQGDVFEIFVEDNKIILQKEEIIEDMCNSLYNLLDVISHILDIDVVVTDIDKCIYASTGFSSIVNKEISSNIVDMILSRKRVKIENFSFFDVNCNFLMQPIIVSGDIEGSVIFVIKKTKIKEIHELICNFVNKLFINKLEV